jgi:hypothetical protein
VSHQLLDSQRVFRVLTLSVGLRKYRLVWDITANVTTL